MEFKSGRNAQVKKLTVRYLDKPEKPCILGFAATDNRDSDALIIRSAVEMGVTEISVLISQYAGFKQSGDTNRFLERRHKIMVGACKQSGRLWLPEITGPMKLEDFLIAYRNHYKYLPAGNLAWVNRCRVFYLRRYNKKVLPDRRPGRWMEALGCLYSR